MLKVVGASWHKTRISTYILTGAFMLGFGALFIADMERPSFNGTYCATAYWARNSGYRIEFWGQRNDLEQVPKGVVRACFRDSVLANGWSQLEIETQPQYSDTVQAYSAGMLEGALTWFNIYTHWVNTIDSVCTRDEQSEEFCKWLRQVITTNVETVKKMADMKGKHDHYWYQIALFYDQLEGLEIGFRNGVKRSRQDYEIPKEDFLLMNAAVDIRDLKIYYSNFLDEESGLEIEPNKGMMLLKIFESNGLVKVLLGHTSDGSYSAMLRMVKKYSFNYHFAEEYTTEDHTVPGTNLVFSGYPGVLASLDDFYVIAGNNHKMVAAGIKIANENVNLWSKIDLVRSVSLAPRVMAANRLAHNGRSWAKFFARNPSTGAKQWVLIDTMKLHQANITVQIEQRPENSDNQITPDESIHRRLVSKHLDDYSDEDLEEPSDLANTANRIADDGLFWVVDQLPGRLHAEDITDKILSDGYWLGNGVPYFKELMEISQVKSNSTNASTVSQHSMEKILNNITDLEALAKFIRQSAYRGDLDPHRPAAFGNIDMKLYSETTNGTVKFRAYSGPLYEPLTEGQTAKRSVEHSIPMAAGGATQPFKWNRVSVLQDVSHQGHPNVWNFEHLSPQWSWL